MTVRSILILLATLVAVPAGGAPALGESTVEVVPATRLHWGYLNPARGDKGPAAADLWGDRTKDTASGILLEFPEGFTSPPHIHNISYRGVVISGQLHNDDPGAESMWMPVGSFWSQPAGEFHITAARGSRNIAYIEIDSGPYLVQPVENAFDNGERPVNLEATNIAWLDESRARGMAAGVEISYLWRRTGEADEAGALLKIPGDFEGVIRVPGGSFRAVVISGAVQYGGAGGTDLPPGSYFGSTGGVEHEVAAGGNEDLVLYVRSTDVVSVQPTLPTK